MGLCFKIIEIWNLFDIWDFGYWKFLAYPGQAIAATESVLPQLFECERIFHECICRPAVLPTFTLCNTRCPQARAWLPGTADTCS